MLTQSKNRGLVLVIVLWFIAILTLLALGFSQANRTDTLVSNNSIERLTARQLATAAAQRGIYGLLAADEKFFDAMISRQPVPVPWDGARLSVALEDENGKININQADESMLEDLLSALEMDREEALALSHAIVDWRDENDLRLLHGAEASEYLAEDMPRLPANRPFLTIEELRQVLGMTPQLFSRLAPLVTIYTGSAEINPAHAPLQVLASLRGTDPVELERFIENRKKIEEEENPTPLLALINVESLISGQVGPVYTVIGRAELPSRTVATRRLVVWIPEERLDQPYFLLESGAAYQRPDGSGVAHEAE